LLAQGGGAGGMRIYVYLLLSACEYEKNKKASMQDTSSNTRKYDDICISIAVVNGAGTGKKHVIFEVRGGPQDIVSALFFSIEEYRLKCPV